MKSGKASPLDIAEYYPLVLALLGACSLINLMNLIPMRLLPHIHASSKLRLSVIVCVCGGGGACSPSRLYRCSFLSATISELLTHWKIRLSFWNLFFRWAFVTTVCYFTEVFLSRVKCRAGILDVNEQMKLSVCGVVLYASSCTVSSLGCCFYWTLTLAVLAHSSFEAWNRSGVIEVITTADIRKDKIRLCTS